MRSSNQLLTVSELGCTAVFYTSTLEANCYDHEGRIFTVLPGRVSLNGALRRLLVEETPPLNMSTRDNWAALGFSTDIHT